MPQSQAEQVSAMINSPNYHGTEFLLPGSVWQLDRPITITRSRITLLGNSEIDVWPHVSTPAFVFVAPELIPADPSPHFPVLGGRRAFRTLGNTVLSAPDSSLANGPSCTTTGWRCPSGWATVKRLQIDLDVELHEGTWGNGFWTLGGVRGGNEAACPWVIEHRDGGLRLAFTDSTGVQRGPVVGLPSGLGSRLQATLYLDLLAGSGQLAVGGTVLPYTVPTGLSLDHLLHGRAIVGVAAAGGQPANGPDMTYRGFRVRIDAPMSIPADDAGYFTIDSATLFALSGEEPSGEWYVWRGGAASQGQPGVGEMFSGHVMLTRVATNEFRPKGVTLSGVNVRHNGLARDGAGVVAWPVIDFTVRGCYFTAGSHAVLMPLGHTNSYPIRVEDISVENAGREAVFLADVYKANVRNVDALACGRGLFRVYTGGIIGLSDCHLTPAQQFTNDPVETPYRFDRCGRPTAERCTANYEGDGSPRLAYFYVSASNTGSTHARLIDCDAERYTNPLGESIGVLCEGSPPTGESASVELVNSLRSYRGEVLKCNPTAAWAKEVD